jgi:molecular chaperone GrpE
MAEADYIKNEQPDTETEETSEGADGMNADTAENAESAQAQDTAEEPGTAEAGSGGTEEEATEEEAGTSKEKALKEKVTALEDRVLRQMAEFENFRKRTTKEKEQMFSLGEKNVIEKILPVVDNFERGLAAAGDNSEDPFAQGMEKIYRQLIQTLEQIGVTPIEAVGKEFDPNFHNAVMHCEDDSVGENVIVQELQKGYMYRDSVVRHSMVKVAN